MRKTQDSETQLWKRIEVEAKKISDFRQRIRDYPALRAGFANLASLEKLSRIAGRAIELRSHPEGGHFPKTEWFLAAHTGFEPVYRP